ncbi:MAG: MATE family efflux transporter [Clostridiales bacterium]|nr:MATE family efflux transporter [Clostridiales bacterium]
MAAEKKASPLARFRRGDVDMTEGGIVRHILTFAFPLLIGNIFQQLYNMVDTWVVGNYVSNAAFSAVGSVGPIINMLIGFFLGLASGAGVVISQYYGAKNEEKVRATVHTSILMTLCMAAVFTVAGVLMAPHMVDMMKAPDDVRPEAITYLTIYFSGVVGLMIYNMGAGILRAVGDSRRPFLFLCVSASLNTVLDLLFVLAFDMGVAGVAWATVIAQCSSAVLVLVTLMRSSSCIRLIPRELRISWEMLRKIVKVGIPAALQMAVTSFSNIFVQSYINYFQTDVMSGWTAYNKIDQILFMPMQSIALASTTFVGQNLGRNQVERARRGVAISLATAAVSTVVMMIPVLVFAPHFVAFFNSKPEVVSYGTMLLRAISPFYVLCCVNQVYSGALRGAGDSRAPMIIMLFSFVLFRQIYLYIMANFIANEIIPIAMGYPAGWLVCSTITFIYYHKASLAKSRVVED